MRPCHTCRDITWKHIYGSLLNLRTGKCTGCDVCGMYSTLLLTSELCLCTFILTYLLTHILACMLTHVSRNRLRPIKRNACPLPEAVTDTKGLRGRPKIGLLMVWAVDRNWPDALMEVSDYRTLQYITFTFSQHLSLSLTSLTIAVLPSSSSFLHSTFS